MQNPPKSSAAKPVLSLDMRALQKEKKIWISELCLDNGAKTPLQNDDGKPGYKEMCWPIAWTRSCGSQSTLYVCSRCCALTLDHSTHVDHVGACDVPSLDAVAPRAFDGAGMHVAGRDTSGVFLDFCVHVLRHADDAHHAPARALLLLLNALVPSKELKKATAFDVYALSVRGPASGAWHIAAVASVEAQAPGRVPNIVSCIAVLPQFRGRGLAERLLAFAYAVQPNDYAGIPETPYSAPMHRLMVRFTLRALAGRLAAAQAAGSAAVCVTVDDLARATKQPPVCVHYALASLEPDPPGLPVCSAHGAYACKGCECRWPVDFGTWQEGMTAQHALDFAWTHQIEPHLVVPASL